MDRTTPGTPLCTPPVGATARRTRTVSRRDIELFTEISGDRNPVHYDAALATRSRFGGLVVQGGVTTALLNAVVAEDLPGPGSVFLHTDWRFRAPVRPDDEITAEVEVLAARADKPVTTLRTTIRNQNGGVVLAGTAVVWRDPTVAAAYPSSSPAPTPGKDVAGVPRAPRHTPIAGTAGTTLKEPTK